MHRDLPTIGIVSIMAKCQPHWIQIGETGISMYMMWYVYTNLCLSTATPHQVRMFYSIFFVRSLSLETPIKIIKGLPHIHIFLFFSCTAFPDLKPRKMPIQWQSQQHISLLPMGMAPLPLLWLVQVLLVALALAQVLALAPVPALALAVLAQVRGPGRANSRTNAKTKHDETKSTFLIAFSQKDLDLERCGQHF